MQEDLVTPSESELERDYVEKCALAAFWADEYERRTADVRAEVAQARASLRAIRRAAADVISHPALRRAARFIQGREAHSSGNSTHSARLAEALARRDRSRERLDDMLWRRRVASWVAMTPSEAVARSARTRLRDGLAFAAQTVRVNSRPSGTLAVVVLGDRLAAARLARQVSNARVVSVGARDVGGVAARVAANPGVEHVLVTSAGISMGSWLASLRKELDDDGHLGAVAPVGAGEPGAPAAGRWAFDLRDGVPIPRLAPAGSDPPAAIGGACVLLRASDLRALAPAVGYRGILWSADVSLALHHADRRVGVVDVVVPAAAGAVPDADLRRLRDRWGSALARRVRRELLSGGDALTSRPLRVAVESPNQALEEACAAATWTAVPPERADLVLRREHHGIAACWAGWRPVMLGDDAAESAASLRRALETPTVRLQIGARDPAAAARSGDLPLAEALASALGRRGWVASIGTEADAETDIASSADVLLQLRGRRPPREREGQRRVLWLISHPKEVGADEMLSCDLVLVGSVSYAAVLSQRLGIRVETLLQFTDPAVFHVPDTPGRLGVVFVGNWRYTVRPIVWDAVRAGIDVNLFGAGWKYVFPTLARADHVPNEELYRTYGAAAIVLADHWDDMRRLGFVSNRIFDALACGALVVSDDVAGLDDLFPGGLLVYRGREDLAATVKHHLADLPAGRRVAERGRQMVLARHTVDHRAEVLDELLSGIAPLDHPRT